MMKYTDKDVKRFWAKVKIAGPDECWEWSAATHKKRMGYGAFGIGKKVVSAHRFSYELAHQKIPDNGHVLHKCDNPKCVNPAHLFIGNHSINNQDKVAKGRAARKLSVEQVLEIRNSCDSQRTIAKRYGISQHMVFRVKHRIAWVHVP